MDRDGELARQDLHQLEAKLLEIQAKIGETRAKIRQIDYDLEIAEKDARDLHDESTAELERQISDFEAINTKVRSNLARDAAMDEAKAMGSQYEQLTDKITDVRKRKTDLLNGANLPLPELGVEEGELTYKGQRWDGMSGADQLRVSTAIVRAINPRCGFVLMDGLEQMDLQTLKSFGAWLEQEGLQVIATRVSTGPECQIIITDGRAEQTQPQPQTAPTWKAGVF